MSQKGLAPLILILLAATAIIIYLLISSSASFKNRLFGLLYPKPSSHAANVESVSDEVLVKFKAGVKEQAKENVKNEHALQKLDEISQIGVERMRVPADRKDKVIEALSHNPRIEYVEPNYIVKGEEVPNDPEYTANRQWAVNKLAMPAAWDISKGSSNVIVAVLDTGAAAHPDLEGKLLPGVSFLNTTYTPDTNGHGTGSSGVIGALTNNSIGVAGICRLCPILPLKVLDDVNLSGSYYQVAMGIYYAVEHGAKVINVSLGGSISDNTLRNAILSAWNNGVITVAAAGNYNRTPLLYPAAEPVVISAGASDASDNRWTGTHYGPDLDVMAPGVGVRSTSATGAYAYMSGTSFSAPHVAGLAALIFSVNPNLTGQQVTDIITSTADKVGTNPPSSDPSYATYMGNGRINIKAALEKAAGVTALSPDTTAPTVNITSPSGGSNVSSLVDINVDASDSVGVTKVEFYLDGSLLGTDVGSPYVASLDTTTLINGSTHNIVAKAYDLANNIGTSSTVNVTVNNPTPTPTATPTPTITPTITDTEKPVVNITNPSSGAVVKPNSKITIQAQVTDNVKVNKVEFLVNNSLKCTSLLSTNPYSCNYSVPGKKNTNYTITVKGYDATNPPTITSITVKAQ